MRIKKFEGESLQDALAKVKRDFGTEAVILHTRKSRKGALFGLLGKEFTEVTAGIDINVAQPARNSEKIIDSREDTQFTPAAGKAASLSAAREKQIAEFSANRRVEDISLKNEALARELNVGKISSAARGSRDPGAGSGAASLSGGLQRVRKLLFENGVEESLLMKILQHLNSQLSDAQINNKQYLDQYLFDYVSSMVQVSGPITPAKGSAKVIAFIGPTGVGKTTTIAKLAARCALIEGRSAVMVSADTYRIAADLQLKKYGEIMGIPVEIVQTPADFSKVINKHTDKDLIFFDTAGRSPRNKKHLVELKEFLDVYSPMEIHLVLGATTKHFDAVSIVNNFGLVPIHRILFTKLDETKNYGMLLNMSVASGGIPLSYIAVGQQVPDDIEPADPKTAARLILKGDFETWIRQRS